jgi:hypothetical protein
LEIALVSEEVADSAEFLQVGGGRAKEDAAAPMFEKGVFDQPRHRLGF